MGLYADQLAADQVRDCFCSLAGVSSANPALRVALAAPALPDSTLRLRRKI